MSDCLSDMPLWTVRCGELRKRLKAPNAESAAYQAIARCTVPELGAFVLINSGSTMKVSDSTRVMSTERLLNDLGMLESADSAVFTGALINLARI